MHSYSTLLSEMPNIHSLTVKKIHPQPKGNKKRVECAFRKKVFAALDSTKGKKQTDYNQPGWFNIYFETGVLLNA